MTTTTTTTTVASSSSSSSTSASHFSHLRRLSAPSTSSASNARAHHTRRHVLNASQHMADPPAMAPSPPITTTSRNSYTSMRDDPVSFWEDHQPLRRQVQHANPESQNPEEEEREEFRVAELRLLANAAADRAEMHAILGTQRDNWNKLFQHTLTASSMAATVLAGLSGAAAAAAAHIPPGSLSALALPAALLNFGGAAMMSVINQFQPSQLAEEQRTATRLFRKLASDTEYALAIPPRLRRPTDVLLRDFRRRLHALDKAFPMPLTPGGLEKFPARVLPPVLIDPLVLPDSHDEKPPPSSAGWNAEVESELLGIAALLRDSDIHTYTTWAQNVVSINKSLAIAAPALAGAAALLNLAQPILVAAGQGAATHSLGLMAAVCSAMATFAGSFSNDMQMGMVAELYRNSAGYYANIEGSIKEALDTPVEQREHGELFRQRVAYELGRCPTDSALLKTDDAAAGTLF